jgi:hypothetical protein
MSAFLVSDTHIDTLVSLAIEGPRGRAPKYPGDGWPAPYFLRPNNTRERSRYEYGTDIGRMLVHENERSMTARYRYEPGDPNAYEYRMPVKRATAIEGLKAIDCYEYQACETGKAFYESRAYDFLTALRSALIGTWIAAEKGDTRGVILRADDAARIVACVNALDGVDDPAAFVSAARALAETVGFATSTKELTIDARRRILTAMTAFLESK